MSMSSDIKIHQKDFVKVTGSDEFDARSIVIKVDDKKILVKDLLEKLNHGQNEIVSHLTGIVAQLNDGYEFSREPAQEWAKYLIALLNGHGVNLINPYSDLINYEIGTFSEDMIDIDRLDSIQILDDMPREALRETHPEDSNVIKKTLYVTALGGTDSSFYNGLSHEEINEFAHSFYGPSVFTIFKKYGAEGIIPRGFASKKNHNGNHVTIVESTILQAYNAGIRHIAVIANSKTKNAINDYLNIKLGHLRDLHVVVTAQPLLPIIKACPRTKSLTISVENGGYQGGHGHGFEHCLKNPQVQQMIEKNNLQFFVFGNGDNAAMLNWGAAPVVTTIKIIQEMRQRPGFENLGIAFFLVWEYLRKGGFVFVLTHKKTGKMITQLFEAELAGKSGADIKSLELSRGGYNTNVAVGIIEQALARFKKLPMALKRKNAGEYTNFLFEASLGTAMTTHQNSDGSSEFDVNAAIYVLGPRIAKFQHWNHISIRKRDDLFAYFTSLYKIKKLTNGFGKFPLVFTERDATQGYPTLKGNIVDSTILDTKRFFEVFKDAILNVDEFFGTIKIDLMQEKGKSRGKIKFEGDIQFTGQGEITAVVPAGESWIVRNKSFEVKNTYSIRQEDVEVTSESR